MSDRDHYHQNYHRNSNNTNNSNRDSPSARRASASSTSYNGGGHSGGKTMPAATMRNSSPSSAVSPSAVAGLSEDLAHLNLPAEVTVGSTVQCTLASSNRIFKGEVVAFDPTVKAIILKSTSSCNRSSLNDVHILNLSQMKELKILNENRDPVADPPSLNVARLQNRLREQVDRKKRLVMAFKAGITPEGQKLFQAIGKTIDEIVWKDENIVVMREVTITPPYKPENVKGISDSKALKHVKKIVEKHLNDQFLLQKQQQEAAVGVRGGAGGDIVVVHNNNNNNNKSETSTPSPALGGTSSPAGAPQQQQHHQSATRTGSTGRYEDGKSGGGGGRPPRQTGGGGRSSTQKRDYDQSKTMYTQ